MYEEKDNVNPLSVVTFILLFMRRLHDGTGFVNALLESGSSESCLVNSSVEKSLVSYSSDSQ